MKTKFENYIKITLEKIGDGENQTIYRENVLNKLLVLEKECRANGMEDEDLIYNTCIEKAGDILSNYNENIEKKENKINNFKKLNIIVGLSLLLATILAYLLTSFITKNWEQTWLIIVGGISAITITESIFMIIKYTKKQKWIPIRIFIAIDILLAFVLIFLCMLILTNIKKTFVLFFIMVIMISGVDTAIAYGINAKKRLINLLVFIQLATAVEYVMLGILEMVPWHPYWLIPLAGALIDIIIISVYLYLNYKNKKEKE